MAVYEIAGSAFGGSSFGDNGGSLVNVPAGADVDECVEKWIEKENQRLKRKFRQHDHAPTFKFYRVVGLVEGLEGVDQWGKFYNLTGLEAVGRCFWCGIETRRRYCCNFHQVYYLRTYCWPDARRWCWKRYANQCGMCRKSRKEWKADQKILWSSQ